MLSECWFFSGFFLPKGKFVIPWTVWFSLHTWQPENRQRKTAHKKKKIYGHLKNLDTIEAGKISPSRDLNTWKKTAVDVGALWLFPNLFFFFTENQTFDICTLPLCTDGATPSQKSSGLVRQDLPLGKLCCMSWITSLPSLCLGPHLTEFRWLHFILLILLQKAKANHVIFVEKKIKNGDH